MSRSHSRHKSIEKKRRMVREAEKRVRDARAASRRQVKGRR